MSRPSKRSHYLKIAQVVSERSTCLRRHYGAVIVKDDQIISTGYNGAPRGDANCCDTNKCVRAEHNVAHGERYELCCAVHAEANAIIAAGRMNTIGSTLFLAGFDVNEDGTTSAIEKPEPCMMCARLIKQAGIKEVIISE